MLQHKPSGAYAPVASAEGQQRRIPLACALVRKRGKDTSKLLAYPSPNGGGGSRYATSLLKRRALVYWLLNSCCQNKSSIPSLVLLASPQVRMLQQPSPASPIIFSATSVGVAASIVGVAFLPFPLQGEAFGAKRGRAGQLLG